ncbi:Riboflavin synthase-like beta-barrel [Niveomyces insectorum RCEF 264]|uniref:NADH-cytochrome b5 reductase n=1 Tax=Niveomyces insectorum RCEF 264 TaxID=1081102 RepID=A0A168A3E4_9HYPO|nr:Riboflavin synthase-like beta-barrel [Niveomyces insectorum RCEF 264]
MFARAAVRTVQTAASPLKFTSRRYATGPSGGGGSGGGGGSSNTALIAAAALAAGAGGYYVISSRSGSGGVAQKAEAAAKEAKKGGSSVADAATAVFKGGDQGFFPLEVAEVDQVSHNTKLVRFKLPAPDQVSGLHAASALLTRFRPSDEAAPAKEGAAESEGKAAAAAKPVIRPYTPISELDAQGHLDLLVKQYEGGPMSTHIHALRPGDTLDFKGPIVKYPWTPNKHDHIALVAGGTGITPMYQLIRTIFRDPAAEQTKVTLVFGNIAQEDILLHKELTALENTYPQRFRAFYVLEKPPNPAWAAANQTGYITKELLKQVLPEPKADNIKVFVCGPPGMMQAISGPKKSPADQGELTGALKELGYSKDQVLKF